MVVCGGGGSWASSLPPSPSPPALPQNCPRRLHPRRRPHRFSTRHHHRLRPSPTPLPPPSPPPPPPSPPRPHLRDGPPQRRSLSRKSELLIHANLQPHRSAARPPLSQLASRRMAVTISYGLNDEYLLQRCSSTCLKRQGGDWYSHLLTNDSRTTRPNLEPCTPTLTSCSLSPTLCEAPARMPADSLSRSPLRDSPQRPQRSGRPRSTRRPELIARRRRSREKE